MNIKKHIPNLISLMNALCGGIATYFALRHGNIPVAIYFMLCSAILDFFDGFAARKLRVFSPLGKDIDSLADVISFGVAPAAMMSLALESIAFALPEIAFLIVPASVYRLAKFNHDTRQSTSFIGLPTPANALFFAGLSYWTFQHSSSIMEVPIMIEYKLYPMYVVVILLMSFLLISEVPMFSLKGTGSSDPKAKRWHLLKIGSVFLIGLITVILWGFTGFAIAILVYLIINLFSLRKHRIP